MKPRYIIIFKEENESIEFDCFGQLCERIITDDWHNDIIAVIEVSQEVGQEVKVDTMDWKAEVDEVKSDLEVYFNEK